MNINVRSSLCLPALSLSLALAALASPAFAAVTMNGDVTLDYYISGTDNQGYESTSSDFYVQQIDNTGGATGPLSLSGWATKGSNPAGVGDEIGHAPIGPAPANSVLDRFSATAPARDLPPGEYYTHVLLQDDHAPGSYDDSRSLTPRMLWRGGLEAVGPLKLYSRDGGRRVSVDFDRLRNNRIDSRYTNDIVLTLYATYGYGPASGGYTLCSVHVAGLYAGDRRYDPGFDCAINAVPDGDYTLHLAVAEAGGRGGSSTLSGPDQYFSGGGLADHVAVSAGALSPWMLAPLLALALLRLQFRRGSWVRAHTGGMKKETVMLGFRPIVLMALCAPLVSQAAVRADPAPHAGARAAAHTAAHASARDAQFSSAELDRLLAPIALYPDSVLTHVLAAATYPLEVVEAARWAREHPKLRGKKAMDAVERMGWDPSVKALVAFPELLARMDSDLQWTQDLGDAFLGSEGAVMDRVQYLRDRADESGHLKSVEHVRVVRERELIYLEPEVAEVIYVPYYDPLIVYGDWWWPAYPPHRWIWWAGHPVSYYSDYGPFYWGLGFPIAPSFYFCAFDWPRREVVIVNHYQTANNYYYGHSPERYEGASHWQHAPEHRHGVAYREPEQNAQWHRGYARPEHDERTESGEQGGRMGSGGGSDEPRREWTVNRAERRDERGDTGAQDRGQFQPRGESQPRSEPEATREDRRQPSWEPREGRRGQSGPAGPARERTEHQDAREVQREDRREVQREERREAPQEQRPEPQPEAQSRGRQAQRREPARDGGEDAGDPPNRGQRQQGERR